MDSDRHSQVKRIFLRACSQSPGQRADFVRGACAGDEELAREVWSLLEFHDEGSAASFGPLEGPPPADHVPPAIGPYKVMRRIGEGGMGIVYEVESTRPIRRRMALKVIKLGLDTGEALARFESERQALALMNHPNIAAVHEAGATEEGRPYFTMEYVEGEAITAYCDRHRLSLRSRLQLMIQVCDGVHHAHQKGVIHRDLKPSNLLVSVVDGAPVPKIIDFGVAKAARDPLTEREVLTAAGVLIGTPQYISPEQASLTGIDVDTRTDVYALGVILYEMLSGALPLDEERIRGAGFEEFRRLVMEQEPPKPSARFGALGKASAVVASARGTTPSDLCRRLRGDLDWIAMKALAKDRTRRYGSAAELREEIRRHLTDEPVEAGPPGTVYRLGKFARRHRAFVAAAVLLFAGVLAGMAMAIVGMRSARREAESSERVARFLEGAVVDLGPSLAGQPWGEGRHEALLGLEEIESDLDGDPLGQARLLTTIGTLHAAGGDLGRARPMLQRALALREEALGPDHFETVLSAVRLGDLLVTSGDYLEARKLHRRALETRRRVAGAESLDVAWSHASLGVIAWRLGELGSAREHLENAVRLGTRARGKEDPDVAMAQVLLAGVELDEGAYEASGERLHRAIAALERRQGPEHASVGEALQQLGILQLRIGETEAARATLERSLAILERARGPLHPSVAISLNELGVALTSLGELERARALLDRALEIRSGTLGDEHPDVAWTHTALGFVRRRGGEIEEARNSYRRGLAIQESAFGPDHYEVSRTLVMQAGLEAEAGNHWEAGRLLHRAVSIRRAIFPPGHRQLALPLYNLACVQAVLGDRKGALSSLREAVESGYASPRAAEDSDLESLHGDPEFESLLARMARDAGRR